MDKTKDTKKKEKEGSILPTPSTNKREMNSCKRNAPSGKNAHNNSTRKEKTRKAEVRSVAEKKKGTRVEQNSQPKTSTTSEMESKPPAINAQIIIAGREQIDDIGKRRDDPSLPVVFPHGYIFPSTVTALPIFLTDDMKRCIKQRYMKGKQEKIYRRSGQLKASQLAKEGDATVMPSQTTKKREIKKSCKRNTPSEKKSQHKKSTHKEKARRGEVKVAAEKKNKIKVEKNSQSKTSSASEMESKPPAINAQIIMAGREDIQDIGKRRDKRDDPHLPVVFPHGYIFPSTVTALPIYLTNDMKRCIKERHRKGKKEKTYRRFGQQKSLEPPIVVHFDSAQVKQAIKIAAKDAATLKK